LIIAARCLAKSIISIMKKPTTNQNTASRITLKSYVLLLKRISDGEVSFIDDLKGDDNRMARELLRSGLASDDARISDFERHIYSSRLSLVITPEGIAALESWSSMLKEKSFLHKSFDNLQRLFWILVGAMISYLAKC